VLETGSVECPAPGMSQPLSLCEVEERGLQLGLKRADVRGVNHASDIRRATVGNCQPVCRIHKTNSRFRKRLVVARHLPFSRSDDSEDRNRL